MLLSSGKGVNSETSGWYWYTWPVPVRSARLFAEARISLTPHLFNISGGTGISLGEHSDICSEFPNRPQIQISREPSLTLTAAPLTPSVHHIFWTVPWAGNKTLWKSSTTILLLPSPRPTCADSLSPAPRSPPSSVSKRLCDELQAIWVILGFPWMVAFKGWLTTGCRYTGKPSCPWLLFPRVYTSPSVVRINEWDCPQHIWWHFMSSRSLTCRGIKIAFEVVPAPWKVPVLTC